jgi:hypothetical protein
MAWKYDETDQMMGGTFSSYGSRLIAGEENADMIV